MQPLQAPPVRLVSPLRNPRARATTLPLPLNPRYRSLDIWRGVACLMVIVFHASLYALNFGPDAGDNSSPALNLLKFVVINMRMGVPLFFVISGYCIAATADATRRLPQALGQFFLRRFRRIFPPYWAAFGLTLLLTLLLSAVAPQLVDLEEGGSFSHLPRLTAITPVEWLSNLTLTESWRYHLVGPGRQGFVLGQAWSLCYEEQFYALCGLLLFLAPRRFFSGTAVITVVVLLLQPIHFIYPGAMRGFFFDGYWLLFALGLLVYYRLNYPPVPLDGLLSLVFCLCPVLFLLSTFGVLNEPRHAGLGTLSYELTIGSLFSLLLLFLRQWDGAFMSSKLLWPLAFCGQMCYSLYLIHWPIAEVIGLGCFLLGVHSLVATLLITVPLTMATSIAAAWLFHRFVERHFLNPPSMSARAGNKV